MHEGLLYPGGYVPSDGTERRLSILRSSRKKSEPNGRGEMKEFPDSYCFEIPLPGARRDDILLVVKDQTLTIDFTSSSEKQEKVRLPRNADMEFVSAEFRNGLLQLHIPKSLVKRVGRINKQIIVY